MIGHPSKDIFLHVVRMWDSEHVFEDFGMASQDGSVDAETFPFGGEDDVSIVYHGSRHSNRAVISCVDDGEWRVCRLAGGARDHSVTIWESLGTYRQVLHQNCTVIHPPLTDSHTIRSSFPIVDNMGKGASSSSPTSHTVSHMFSSRISCACRKGQVANTEG